MAFSQPSHPGQAHHLLYIARNLYIQRVLDKKRDEREPIPLIRLILLLRGYPTGPPLSGFSEYIARVERAIIVVLEIGVIGSYQPDPFDVALHASTLVQPGLYAGL